FRDTTEEQSSCLAEIHSLSSGMFVLVPYKNTETSFLKDQTRIMHLHPGLSEQTSSSTMWFEDESGGSWWACDAYD
ncbi:hypothetical protein A2U01_0014820, partial [Trifolium medium]|nr:hypothetical protein [Trifolium medium]